MGVTSCHRIGFAMTISGPAALVLCAIQRLTAGMAEMTPGRRVRLRIAGVLSVILGLGFGIPGAYGTWYFANTSAIWYFMGYPTNGRGPFEDIGIETSVPLLAAFVMVCAAAVVCGVLLFRGRRAGIIMSVVLLPIELAFWVGFDLPFAFPLGIARTVLAVWPSRRVTSGSSGTR
jgi:hypothetical protein